MGFEDLRLIDWSFNLRQLARIKLNENGPGGESSEEDVDDAGDKDDDFGDNATDKR